MQQTRYYKITITFLLAQVLTFGQNLVSNGSFESYINCFNGPPTTSNKVVDWYVAALSPDYFNSCDGAVPEGFAGFQQDCCGGHGYFGIYTITNDAQGDLVDRDYIGTKLVDTLLAGHKYLASMYVNKSNGFNYAIATIGMLFTDTTIVLPYPQGFINASPQINNTTLLTDTANWMLVQDTLIAIGNETYLTIGNFNTTATSDTVNVGGNGWFSGINSYYYIDGVSVYDVATLGVNNIESRKLEITVYPNPANNYLKITCNSKFAVCRLEDVLGKVIKTQELKNAEEIMHINDLPSGVYFLNVKTTESLFSKKIIIQH